MSKITPPTHHPGESGVPFIHFYMLARQSILTQIRMMMSVLDINDVIIPSNGEAWPKQIVDVLQILSGPNTGEFRLLFNGQVKYEGFAYVYPDEDKEIYALPKKNKAIVKKIINSIYPPDWMLERAHKCLCRTIKSYGRRQALRTDLPHFPMLLKHLLKLKFLNNDLSSSTT